MMKGHGNSLPRVPCGAARAATIIGDTPLHDRGREEARFEDVLNRLAIHLQLGDSTPAQLSVAEYREFLRSIGIECNAQYPLDPVAQESMRNKLRPYAMGNASLK